MHTLFAANTAGNEGSGLFLTSDSRGQLSNCSMDNAKDQWVLQSSTLDITACLPGTYFLPTQPQTEKLFWDQCPFLCPNGTFGPGTRYRKGDGCDHPCNACPEGTYCDRKGMHTPTPCPAGRYGMATGLFTASCSGECSPGYYCPVQSTSRTAFACPPGRYRGNTSAQSADDCRPRRESACAAEPALCRAVCRWQLQRHVQCDRM